MQSASGTDRRRIQRIGATLQSWSRDGAFGEVDALRPDFLELRAGLIANADLFLSREEGQSDAALPIAAAAIQEDQCLPPQRYQWSDHANKRQGRSGRGGNDANSGQPVGVNRPHFETRRANYEFRPNQIRRLHLANGGLLLLDVHRVMSHPFARDWLRRRFETMAIEFTTAGERLGLVSSTTPEPQPVPVARGGAEKQAKLAALKQRPILFAQAKG